MRKRISWLFKEPPEEAVPAFDRCVLPLVKAGCLGVRGFSRLFMGREKRSKSRFLRKFWLSDSASPSFYLISSFYRSFGLLGRSNNNPRLVKIRKVQEYDYQYYCRVEDFSPSREDDIIRLFAPREGDVIVDIGAHIGRYTIIASKMAGPRGKVVAIEAHPANYGILKKNIDLNGLAGNVVPLNYAVASRETTVKLYEPGQEDGFTIYNTIMSERAVSRQSQQKYIEVDADTLDSLLQLRGIREVNWIKIDVEGAELEVLKGALNTLSRSKDISLLIEIHNLNGDHSTLYEPIMELLKSHHFDTLFEKAYESGEKHVIVSKGGRGLAGRNSIAANSRASAGA